MAITLLNSPGDQHFSKNMIPLQIQSSLGYGAYFNLLLRSTTDVYGGTSVTLAVQRLYVNQLGIAEIDLQSIFDAGFPYIEQPDITALYSQQPYGKIQRAEYAIAEFDYDGTPHDLVGNYFDLYRGGVPRDFERGLDPIAYLLSTPQWWSWKPDFSVVSKRQPEWLTIKLPLASIDTEYDIKFVVTDIDGNTYTKTIVYPATGTNGFDIFWIPVGFDDNDLTTLIGAAIPSTYTVTAYKHGTATVIAKKRTYVIDHVYRPFERFYMFTNSLGGFDTLRTIGEASTKGNYVDIDADVNMTVDPTIVLAPNQRLETTEQFTTIVNTGYRTKEEVDWLRDLRLAVDVYEVVTVGGAFRLQPIRLSKSEMVQAKDNDDLKALVFEYKKAYDNNTYSAYPLG